MPDKTDILRVPPYTRLPPTDKTSLVALFLLSFIMFVPFIVTLPKQVSRPVVVGVPGAIVPFTIKPGDVMKVLPVIIPFVAMVMVFETTMLAAFLSNALPATPFAPTRKLLTFAMLPGNGVAGNALLKNAAS